MPSIQSIYKRLARLDDESAVGALLSFRFRRSILKQGGWSLVWPEVSDGVKRLRRTDRPRPRPSEGELARTGLLVLAGQPERREELAERLAAPPSPMEDDVLPRWMLLAMAMLKVLQTHVRFHLEKDERVTAETVRKPRDRALLGEVAELLVAFVDDRWG